MYKTISYFILLLILSVDSFATTYTQNRNFSLRNSINTKGDLKGIGNTTLCKSSNQNSFSYTNGTCVNLGDTEANDDFFAIYADIDGDSSTFSSTSADLSLPNGSKVLWAGLYWQGQFPNSYTTDKNTAQKIKFKRPNGTYQTVTATQLDYDSSTDGYQGFANVTSLINSTAPNGTYYIADLTTALGKNAFGAWALKIIYEDNTDSLKNITIFDGYKAILQNSTSQTIDVSGFRTPLTGTVASSFTIFASEGDAGTSSEGLQIKNGSGSFVNIFNTLNPNSNQFNSNITYKNTSVTTRVPNDKNTAGVDLDTYDISGILGNNQTLTQIKLNGNGSDRYYCGVFGFATQIYSPTIGNFDKNVSITYASNQTCGTGKDLRGATLNYEMTFENTGTEAASNVRVYDDFQSNGILNYLDMTQTSIPSAQLLGGTAAGSITCDKNVTAVYCDFNRINIGTKYKINFATKIKNTLVIADDLNISNTANAHYYNASTGDEITQIASSNMQIAGGVCAAFPVADYRFDECEWIGTTGEVKDEIGDHNGTISSTTLSNDAKLIKSAYFNGNSSIEIGDIMALRNTASLSFWIKTTQRSNSDHTWGSPGLIGVKQSGGGDDIIWGFIDKNGKVGIDVGTTGSSYAISNTVVSTGQYYHVVLTRNKDNGEIKVYINGSQENSKIAKTGTIGNTFTKLGVIRDTGSTSDYLNATIDEVKIFDRVLSDTEILTIYNNESDEKNYDGSIRYNPHCSPNLNTCWIETFTEPSLAGKWDVSGTGYTPQVTSNRLRLTPATGNIATLAILSGELPADNNFIEIEFDQFAYNGNGADGMTLTLSDASITPVTGASGGSLGYAQKTGVNGFAGGWLGFGMDEYGNFSNPTEGRIGGPGFRADAFAIRGSGNGTNGYTYLTGTTTLSPQIDNNSNGHQYKLSIDTRFNQTWVKVERKTSTIGSYIEIIPWYNATQNASAPGNFRLSLTASTGGSNNIHEADNFNLKAINCGTIGVPIPQTNFAFDAWDSFRSINDRNISTKIVNKPFALTIAALNDTNTAYKDFNGTVCAKIVNSADQNISGWNKLLFNDQNRSTTTFTLNRAIGGSDSAGVELYWKKNVDTTCPITAEDNSTIASDRFSVRPDDFNMTASNAIAGVNFNIIFTAPNFSGNASSDYNESAGSSFDVSVAEHNPLCPMGTFNPIPNSFSFVNGTKVFTTRYSEVGVLDVNITDLTKGCGSRFANIDCDDADVAGYYNSASDLPIGLFQSQITVKPHHFDVTGTLSNFDGGTFTYLSDDLNMSANLDLNITAKNGEGNTTANYSSACYAKNTDLTLTHSTIPSPLTKILYTETLSAINTNVLKNDPWILTLNANLFNSGSVIPNIDLNFDRSPTKPLNPFDFNITSATAKDVDNVTGTGAPVGDATFVYGRVHPYDITTNISPVHAPIELEVYSTTSDGFVSGMPQNVLKWYRNLDHDTASQGNVILGGFSAGVNDGAIVTSSAPSDGLQILEITSITDRTIHLDISKWLWYSPKYGYNYTGDCTRHPCLNYDYTDISSGIKGVNTGTFQGSDFPMAPAEKITNKGVKLFR